MFIIDYSLDFYGNKELTKKLEDKFSVIDFIADQSCTTENFKVIRINKYEKGRLIEYVLRYSNRIDLQTKEEVK